MNRGFTRYLPLLLVLSLVAISGCRTGGTQTGRAIVPTKAQGDYRAVKYSQGELDQLVGPIALYPDPLLAQVLPASTFEDQVQDAAAFLRHKGGSNLIDEQDWDTSVRSVAHYPTALYMMADRPDWTTALGQAYVDEPNDVMDAIQRMRGKSRDLGYLYPNDRQNVIVQAGYTRIVPANPRLVYVPRYDPQVVYVRRAPSRRDTIGRDLLIFGAGFLIGSWLNRDTDWGHHRVYYHGWNGGGWVGRSRRYVTINNYYVNDRYANRPIYLNRSIARRDISPYRNELRRHEGFYSAPASITRPTYIRRISSAGGPRRLAPTEHNGRLVAGAMRPDAGRRTTSSAPQHINRPTPGTMLSKAGRRSTTSAQEQVGGPISGTMRTGAGRRTTVSSPTHAPRTVSSQQRGGRSNPLMGKARDTGMRTFGSAGRNAGRRTTSSQPMRAPRTISDHQRGGRSSSVISQPRHAGRQTSGSMRSNSGRRTNSSQSQRAPRTISDHGRGGRGSSASDNSRRIGRSSSGQAGGGRSVSGRSRGADRTSSQKQSGGRSPSGGKRDRGSSGQGNRDKGQRHGRGG